MKTTVFALAALLASSGLALAGGATKPSTDAAACTAAQIKSGKVDCAPTGSIDSTSADKAKGSAGKPKLGYDGSPWIVPSFN